MHSPRNRDDPNGNSEPVIRASVAQMAASGEPHVMEPVKHDLLTPEGKFRERYWQVTHSPIYGGPAGTGEIVGALQTARDVTSEIVRQKTNAAQQRAAMIGGQLAFFELVFETDWITGSDGFDTAHGLPPDHDGYSLETYYERVHPDERDATVAMVDRLRTARSGTQERNDYRVLWADGTLRWLTARIEVVPGAQGRGSKLTGVLLDVTDLRQSEDDLRNAVAQRDLLIAEVNHRVKNSLQLVTSVLSLEAKASSSEAVRAKLESAGARIQAIATIHASLYEDDDVGSVRLDRYLERFCRHLSISLGAEARTIELNVEAEPVSLSTNKAITLSLAVNELVANAFKHAFDADGSGRVDITLVAEGDDRAILTIADDGKGADEDGDAGATGHLEPEDGKSGLGNKLISGSVRQLGGTMELATSPEGWSTTIEFPL